MSSLIHNTGLSNESDGAGKVGHGPLLPPFLLRRLGVSDERDGAGEGGSPSRQYCPILPPFLSRRLGVSDEGDGAGEHGSLHDLDQSLLVTVTDFHITDDISDDITRDIGVVLVVIVVFVDDVVDGGVDVVIVIVVVIVDGGSGIINDVNDSPSTGYNTSFLSHNRQKAH